MIRDETKKPRSKARLSMIDKWYLLSVRGGRYPQRTLFIVNIDI